MDKIIDVHVIASPGRMVLREAMYKTLVCDEVIITEYPANGRDISSVRRRAIEEATCEWVSFVDDDDLVVSNAYQEIIRNMREDDFKSDIYYTHEHQIDIRDKITCTIRHKVVEGAEEDVMNIDTKGTISHIVVLRREFALKYLEDMSLFPIVGDQLLIWCAVILGKVFCIPRPLYKWRRHLSSVSVELKLGEEIRQAQKHFREKYLCKTPSLEKSSPDYSHL